MSHYTACIKPASPDFRSLHTLRCDDFRGDGGCTSDQETRVGGSRNYTVSTACDTLHCPCCLPVLRSLQPDFHALGLPPFSGLWDHTQDTRGDDGDKATGTATRKCTSCFQGYVLTEIFFDLVGTLTLGASSKRTFIGRLCGSRFSCCFAVFGC